MTFRTIFPIAVTALMGLCLTACDYEDDESELLVYLPGKNLGKYKEKVDEAEALINAHQAEAEAYVWNSINPDYRFGELAPDMFIHTKEGYVGVVDLGLSKKWACVNLGGNIPQAMPIIMSLKEYFGVLDKPNLSNATSATVPYNDYVSGGGYSIISEETIEAYIQGANAYAFEYAKYAEDYYRKANVKYSFVTGGFDGYVIWGYPDFWKANCNTVADTRLTAELDAATQLWGSEWATPSRSDLNELLEKCTWKTMTFNGQTGAEIIGPSGKAIWLPTVGAKDTNGQILKAGIGYYLSNEKDIQNTLFHAYVLCCNTKNGIVRTQPGELGYCLRPILK